MIPVQFINSCSEEEKSILYIILWQTFQPCGYEPSFECVRFLRKDILLKIFNNLKSQILPEYLSILEELSKKVIEEI
jgi:hypothetical protein